MHWLLWLRPANRKVAGLVPGQGTCLGCRLGPQLGACERQRIDVSLLHGGLSSSLLPSLPLSLKISKLKYIISQALEAELIMYHS